MRVSRLTIENFRGVKSAELYFDGHALLVGPNNVGKSTICEALDLTLGPDRLNRFPPVEEFDFYNAEYLTTDPDQPTVPIRIAVVLTDLTQDVENTCAQHVEFWHTTEKRVLGQGEGNTANPPLTVTCLRLETVATYNVNEDEFEAETYFTYSPDSPEGELRPCRRNTKRLFGFLYLRALRTGARALSLERGSLLDVILRLQGIQTGLWEKSITRLRDLEPPIDQDIVDLTPVLESIEKRLATYIPIAPDQRATRLFVSQLTREHLRKTMAFFLAISPGQRHVPFQEAGTGTLNTLVLALLSFIADIKPDNVIFAMEEPEIALPPHTQRRIADYLLGQTTQAFLTSHSPYVIERFDPSQVTILRRDASGALSGLLVSTASQLSPYTYRRFARRGLSEAILGNAAIIAEGVSEVAALTTVARRMESENGALFPLDLAGITIFDADGDGQMPAFGSFLKTLGLMTFSFYDNKTRTVAQKLQFREAYDIDNEYPYQGLESLLATEVPVNRQWDFLAEVRNNSESTIPIPTTRPLEETIIRDLTRQALRSNKGYGWASRLLDACALPELPPTIAEFLMRIYELFPRPEQPPPPITTVSTPALPAAGP